MKKQFILLMVVLLINSLIVNAQVPKNYVVQPKAKTYTKFKNPLLKINKPVSVLIVNGEAYLEGDIYLGSESELDNYQNSMTAWTSSGCVGLPLNMVPGFFVRPIWLPPFTYIGTAAAEFQ